MKYPLVIDYIDSIKYAEQNFAKLTNLQPILDENNNPIYKTEESGIIFKMKDICSQKRYCVKCFFTEQRNRKDFYNIIVQSKYFYPFEESSFLEDELYVDTEVSNNGEFPVFVYPWSKCECIVDYIKLHINNSKALNLLAYRFSQIVKWAKERHFIWKKLDVANIFMRADGYLYFADIENILINMDSDDNKAPLSNDVSIVMMLLSLKAIALNSSLFDPHIVKSLLLFTDKDDDCIKTSETLQQLLLLGDREVNSLIGYLLICLNFNSDFDVNSNIFGFKPTFESEFDELLYYAENGNHAKQVDLARVYYEQKAYSEAFRWYEAAARQGNPDGINGMGLCYMLGRSVKKDEHYAVQLFTQATDKGSLHAQINLAISYYRGRGVELDWEKAFVLFKKAAELGDAYSQYMVGKYYMHSHGVNLKFVSKRDTNVAYGWFEKSAKQGFARAEQYLGMFYESGTDPCIRNLEKAFEWYTRAANQDDRDALFALGRLYENGIDEKNPDLYSAYRFFLKAAECGHPEAQYRVGVALYYGKGVSIDKQSALLWLNKAVAQRNEAAQRLLAQLQSNENPDVTTDNTEVSDYDLSNAKMDSYGVLYSSDGKKLLHYSIDDTIEDNDFGILSSQSLKHYEVLEGVEIICDGAFGECESLEDILLPSSIKMIGRGAFYGCFNLESIIIPEGVTIIEEATFEGCSSLQHLVLPHSLKIIKPGALTGVKDIESYSPNYIVKNGCLFSADLSNLICFFNNGIEEFEIPNGTKCLANHAFENSVIRKVLIPNTVERIGEDAFARCDKLQDIIFPSSIIEIGAAAFINCESLYNIKLPKNLKHIEAQTFSHCHNLTHVQIPDSVEEIGFMAFGLTKLESVCLPKKLKRLGGMAFVSAPLEYIESKSEFMYVENMTIYSKEGKDLIQYYGHDKKFIIPNTVVSISMLAFAGAFSIKELVIPSSVKEIGLSFLKDISPNKIVVPRQLMNIVKERLDSFYHDRIFIIDD